MTPRFCSAESERSARAESAGVAAWVAMVGLGVRGTPLRTALIAMQRTLVAERQLHLRNEAHREARLLSLMAILVTSLCAE